MIAALKLALKDAKERKGLVALNLVVMLAAAIFEVFGVGMLVPLLESIDGRGGQGGRVIQFFHSGFESLGIPYGFASLITVFGGIMLAKYALVAYQEHLARVLNADIGENLMNRGFANLMDVPLSFYYNQKIGDLVATEFTSARNAGAMLEHVMLFGKTLLFALAYIAMGCAISVPFTLFICGLASLAYFFVVPRFRKGLQRGQEEKDTIDGIHSYLLDTLGGIRVVKGFKSELRHTAAFSRLARAFRNLNVSINDNVIIAHLFFEPLIFTMVVASLLFAVNVLALPLAELMVLLFIFIRLAPQAKLVNGNILQINQLTPHFQRIHGLIDRADKRYLSSGAGTIGKLKAGIRIEDLSFSYPGTTRPALSGIQLEIPKNSAVAFVGHSGGGKSTLVDLILRHHDPNQGTIRVDGRDLRDLQLEGWRRLIGVVDQDPYLFNDSVRYNILYGKPDASESELIRAAQIANAHEFILALPNGYDTIVGNRGMVLSGGQKQRIGLARALIRDPQILILDEATSSLDSESERLIQDAIQSLRAGKTLIIIAHRLSTVAGADKIILIEDGKILEEGAHQTLIAADGRYRQFYNLQQGETLVRRISVGAT